MQELFIYYRCRLEHAQQVRSAVRAWQRELGSRHPALACRLMRRDRGDEVTFMEIYAGDEALSSGTPLHLELAHGPPALATSIEGRRHVEAFVPCA